MNINDCHNYYNNNLFILTFSSISLLLSRAGLAVALIIAVVWSPDNFLLQFCANTLHNYMYI